MCSECIVYRIQAAPWGATISEVGQRLAVAASSYCSTLPGVSNNRGFLLKKECHIFFNLVQVKSCFSLVLKLTRTQLIRCNECAL